MTVYYRKTREDFLADTALSLEAHRLLSYMMAQAPGFTFQLEHMRQVFNGKTAIKIGTRRLENARAELLRGGWFLPGKAHRDSDGCIVRDGATVNWPRVMPTFPQVAPEHVSYRRVGDVGELTDNEVTDNELRSEPAQRQATSARSGLDTSPTAHVSQPASVRPMGNSLADANARPMVHTSTAGKGFQSDCLACNHLWTHPAYRYLQLSLADIGQHHDAGTLPRAA